MARYRLAGECRSGLAIDRWSSGRAVGFTIVEMLVALAVILILCSLLLPAINAARESARKVICLNNVRVLTNAWISYSADNKGALVSGATSQYGWAADGNRDADIRRGLLYPYVPSVNVYKCPSDNGAGNDRSYSINCVLNTENWGQTPFQFQRQIKTGQTFVFIEELDPRGFNEGGFALMKTGDMWVDFPAHFHEYGSSISFADGHGEFWQWSDPRTVALSTNYVTTPNNPDLKRLQTACGY